MNEKEKKIRKLTAKLNEAAAKGDFIRQIKLMKELDEINQLKIEVVKTSFKKAAANCSQEIKNEGFAKLVYLIALTDMLNGASMELSQWFKKAFNMINIEIVQKIDKAIKELKDVVAMIDQTHDEFFSYSYMEVVEKLELQYSSQMQLFIYNNIAKFAKEFKSNIQGK